MSETFICPNCREALYTLQEFCPHCRVRLFYPVKPPPPVPPSVKGVSPPRSNASELESAANLCARLAGASWLWPVVAFTIVMFKSQSFGALVALLLGLVPAVLGAGLFMAASYYLRAEKKHENGSSDLLHGVLFGLLGAAVWGYALRFFTATSF